MKWLGIVLMILPKLKSIMEKAKLLFDDVEDTGAEKKQYVMAIVKEIAFASLGVTGPEWEKLWARIEAAVDIALEILYLFFFKDDEVVEDETQEIAG